MWNYSGPFDSMAFGPDDILYGHVGGGYGYCWLDPKSFATSTIAQPVVNLINPSGPGTAIAISNDGMGVGWGRFSTTGDQLYTFDISTGGITFLGNLPVSGEFVALDYTQDGRLLGLTGNCAIYEIDIDSLAITHLRSFENTGVTYGFAVVPEPTTLLLLGLGGLALRKRK